MKYRANAYFAKLILALFFTIAYSFLLTTNKCFSQDSTVIRALENAYDIDQKIREEWYISDYRNGSHAPKTDSLLRVMVVVDSLNQILLKDIFEKYGFLGISKVGEKAARSQWLIVHHSVDSLLCEKYLEIFRIEMEKGEIEKWAYAYLDDRVRLRRGEKQLYGTQQRWNKEKNRFELGPIEDPENLHKRRVEMGMETDEEIDETDTTGNARKNREDE